MKKSYTLVIASSQRGTVRKLRVPAYALHALAALVAVGGITVLGAVGSYSRMLWKVANYDQLRREQATLQKRYSNLQEMVRDSNQRLSSLQSLATEVAVSYGIMRFRNTPFGLAEEAAGNPLEADAGDNHQRTVDQYYFLMKNASSVALAAQGGLQLMPGRAWSDLSYTPSMWPVHGYISGSFGERLDPFNGEGAFHAGVDISSNYGDPVRATADGLVTAVEMRAGYGRVVVVDHGFGLSTWYGHLSGFNTNIGTRVTRGAVIGFVGTSGRATGPHVHYEVRLRGAPVNPWRYLRGAASSGD